MGKTSRAIEAFAKPKNFKMPAESPTLKGMPGYDNVRDVIDEKVLKPGSQIIGPCSIEWSDPNLLFKKGSTTIVTINMTTGIVTLGGTLKQLTCLQINGA